MKAKRILSALLCFAMVLSMIPALPNPAPLETTQHRPLANIGLWIAAMWVSGCETCRLQSMIHTETTMPLKASMTAHM